MTTLFTNIESIEFTPESLAQVHRIARFELVETYLALKRLYGADNMRKIDRVFKFYGISIKIREWEEEGYREVKFKYLPTCQFNLLMQHAARGLTLVEKIETDELIKIEMYKKIASIESKEDMHEVQEELEDRFSDIPKSVETLLKIAYIKTLCKKLKIEKVRQIKDEILLNPLTRYKTKEKIGYNIVNELEELLENMCNLKSN